jgi:hypothetical protein
VCESAKTLHRTSEKGYAHRDDTLRYKSSSGMPLESDPESLFLVSLRSVSRLFSMSTFRRKRLSGWTSRVDSSRRFFVTVEIRSFLKTQVARSIRWAMRWGWMSVTTPASSRGARRPLNLLRIVDHPEGGSRRQGGRNSTKVSYGLEHSLEDLVRGQDGRGPWATGASPILTAPPFSGIIRQHGGRICARPAHPARNLAQTFRSKGQL